MYRAGYDGLLTASVSVSGKGTVLRDLTDGLSTAKYSVVVSTRVGSGHAGSCEHGLILFIKKTAGVFKCC